MTLQYMWDIVISIHTPTKGATDSTNSSKHSPGYFNPHSHEGSDFLSSIKSESITMISIHTPTKGATNLSTKINTIITISIHTPTKGATEVFTFSLPYFFYFNPHSHEGSDSHICPSGSQNWISIHTPTKGATIYR